MRSRRELCSVAYCVLHILNQIKCGGVTVLDVVIVATIGPTADTLNPPEWRATTGGVARHHMLMWPGQLSIDAAGVIAAGCLSWEHKDPFD
jgi:hypothetical protein